MKLTLRMLLLTLLLAGAAPAALAQSLGEFEEAYILEADGPGTATLNYDTWTTRTQAGTAETISEPWTFEQIISASLGVDLNGATITYDSGNSEVDINSDVNVGGDVTAVNFIGNGAQLTNVSSSAIAGRLQDADNDTVVDVEATTDSDTILISAEGVSAATVTSATYEVHLPLVVNDAGAYIQGDNVKIDGQNVSATNDSGLGLHDNAGNGLTVEDGGQIGMGTASPAGTAHTNSANTAADNIEVIIESDMNAAGETNWIEFRRSGGVPLVRVGGQVDAAGANANDGAFVVQTTSDAGSSWNQGFYLSDNARVSFGTQTEEAKVYIENSEALNSLEVADEASDATPFVVDQSGNVAIKKAVPAVSLDVVGAIAATGDLDISGHTDLVNTSVSQNITVGGTATVEDRIAMGAHELIADAGSFSVIEFRSKANNTAPRVYIAPKGSPSGTKSKLELFWTDYPIADSSNYAGLTWYGSDSGGDRWHIASNYSGGVAAKPIIFTIENAGSIVYTAAEIETDGDFEIRRVKHTKTTPGSLAAGSSVPNTTSYIEVNQLSTVTLTSTPSILTSSVEEGTEINVANVGTNSFTLQDESNLAGSDVRSQSGADITISAGTMRSFVFNGADWMEK